MTAVLHLDDLKVSQESDKAIKTLIEYLDEIYPVIKVVHGDVHEYLGMRLDYPTKGQVEVSMTPYMKKSLENYPEEITTTAPMPTTKNIFQVQYDKDAMPLTERKPAQFHHVVAQIMLSGGRVRWD